MVDLDPVRPGWAIEVDDHNRAKGASQVDRGRETSRSAADDHGVVMVRLHGCAPARCFALGHYQAVAGRKSVSRLHASGCRV